MKVNQLAIAGHLYPRNLPNLRHFEPIVDILYLLLLMLMMLLLLLL